VCDIKNAAMKNKCITVSFSSRGLRHNLGEVGARWVAGFSPIVFLPKIAVFAVEWKRGK